MQAFERSLVEAAENFSHNLAALRSYEANEEVDEREGGLKRSLSEHYLPAVAVPDFAEVAFDAIRRAQRMRQVGQGSVGNPNLFSRCMHCCPTPYSFFLNDIPAKLLVGGYLDLSLVSQCRLNLGRLNVLGL